MTQPEPPPESPGDEAGAARASPRRAKSPQAFRTISEVADELQIPQHVLRFWESRFPQIKPLKRGGGRRYYRPEDIALLRRIGDLLYVQGYTIKGVQRLLRDGGEGESHDMADDGQQPGTEPGHEASELLEAPGAREAGGASPGPLFGQGEPKGTAATPAVPRRRRTSKVVAAASGGDEAEVTPAQPTADGEVPKAAPDPQEAAEIERLRGLLAETGSELAAIAAELRLLRTELS